MNFVSKSDSYSAALAMIEMGMGISLLDDNTLTKVNLEKAKISEIRDEIISFVRGSGRGIMRGYNQK